jgi:hypothetical protein
MKYPIGTKFKTRGKHPKECVVVDYLTTTNLNGDIVKQRYVAQHEFLGQVLTDYDVVETTISRGLV